MEQVEINDGGCITISDPISTGVIFEYCTVQPTKGSDLLVLPEGIRNQVVYKCYVSDIANTVIEQTNSLPDMVSYKGLVYDTHYTKGWQNINNTGTGQTSLIPHYEILLVKTSKLVNSASFVKDINFTLNLPDGYTELDWNTLWGYTV